MEPKQSRNQPQLQGTDYISYGLLGIVLMAATWGVAVVLDIYSGGDLWKPFTHFPFWMMLGSIGVLLNYIPIAKSKPKLIPILGIAISVVTTAWFCFDNFIELEGFQQAFGRLRLGVALLVACYCFAHLSLLMLTHRKNHDNMLLVMTGVMIALSGIAYVFLLSGFAVVETFLLALTIALSLFFIKFALTIALVVLSLNTVRSDSQETLRNNRQKYPPSAIDRIS
jgi:hypothetical protein